MATLAKAFENGRKKKQQQQLYLSLYYFFDNEIGRPDGGSV